MIVRRAKLKDVKKMREIMVGFELPKSVFITSSEDRIRYLVENNICLICEDGKEILGFVLTEGSDYIDTICSKGGVGKLLLQTLPDGEYEVNISDLNFKSKKLFIGLGFEYMYDEIVEGEQRGRYKGYLRQRNIA